MTRTANQVFAEVAQIEATLNDPVASKGRVNALKAAHRKLARELYKLLGA